MRGLSGLLGALLWSGLVVGEGVGALEGRAAVRFLAESQRLSTQPQMSDLPQEWLVVQNSPQREPSVFEGELSEESQIFDSDGTYFNIHTFTGQAGENIKIDLVSDQFNAFLLLLDSDGNTIAKNDDGGENKNARIVITLPVDGEYFILANSYQSGEVGRYRITLQSATANNDEVAVRAEQLFQEGQTFRRDGSLESLQAAIEKWEAAVHLYQQVGDRGGEANTLHEIGSIYDDLGEKSRALEYYNQALLIRREVGDRGGEAATLNNIGMTYSDLGEKSRALEFFNQALPLLRAVGDRGGEAATLNNIGLVYNALGEKSRALEFFNQALPPWQAVGDRGGEALTLTNIGAVYDSLGEKSRALEYYNQALPLLRAVGDRSGEAVTLTNIGAVYDSLGETSRALEFLNQALPLFRAVGNRGGEASTLNNIGLVYSNLGEKSRALEYYNQALPLARAVGDRGGEASALNNIGGVYSSLGEKSRALEYYNQALPLWQAIGDRSRQANTLNGIGLVYNSLGEKSRALEYYNQALPLARAVGDRGGEASALNNIGGVYSSLGEKSRALEYYNQALPLWQAIGDRSGEALTFNNIGRVYDDLGEKSQALEYLNQTLPLYRAVGNRSGEAMALNSIGAVYSDLGEKSRALEYYNQALPLRRAVGDLSGEGTTLNNIGYVYLALGEHRQALEYLNQALPLRRAVGDLSGEAQTLTNIGAVYNALGEKSRALEFFNQALPLDRAVGDRGGEGVTLNNIGAVYDALGEKSRALEYFNQALPLYQAVGDISGEATTLRNVADTQREQGELTAALANIQASIELIEKLRSFTPPGELRQTYFATVQDYYQFYLDLLMELHQQNPNQGYDTQAFQVSESSRARVLVEQLAEANLDIRQGVDPQLLAQEQTLIQQLTATEQQRITLTKDGSATTAQIEAIKTQLNQIFQNLQTVETQIRRQSPAYANIKFPQPLSLQEVQNQILDDNTLLLEYALGKDRSFLFVVSKTTLQTFELPPQADIEAAVNTYRDQLNTPDFTDLSQGQQLSEMLLGQIANQLGNKRLLIVSNGQLQLLPFGALPNPESTTVAPLLANHEIINLPSATSLAIQRQTWANRPPAPKTVAIIADPVFDPNDDRFATNITPQQLGNQDLSDLIPIEVTTATRAGCLGFSRLPHTGIEANNILALVPDAQKFVATGFEANHAAATAATLNQYQILHLATHGCIQDNARLSNLALTAYNPNGQLANNPALHLQDIYNLKLNADLVVLSACETGTGANVAGEGIVGLTSGFMYAGAKRVVVSLWSVSDVSTANLMSDFYRRMLQQKTNPNQALRQAQLAMWNSDSKYRAPYYWAAFTLQGEF